MKRHFTINAINALGIVFLIVFLSNHLSVISAMAADQQDESLFTEATNIQVRDADEPYIIRSRFVNINFGLLSKKDRTLKTNSDVSTSLVLNLFNDIVFTVVLDRVAFNMSGSYSWFGHLDGIEESQVTLVIKDEVLSGNITLPGAFYQVRYKGDGLHAIYEIDQSTFPPEKEPIPIDISYERETPDMAMADDGSAIDVMTVYTGAARSAAGGTSAMETLIDLAISETNTGYSNSGVTQRVNLVHTAEVSYDESGFNWETTLGRLQDPTDGYMDNVHTLRDTYSADEVVLIVNNTGYCGIAYLMTSVSSSFESWAFALVSSNCATGYYSFAHEMGHNMAARHDWYVDGTVNSPYSYNHGYVAPAKNWRTIMSYSNDCSGCMRLNYWSNPAVSYGGVPMGVAEGTSTSCNEGQSAPNCDADNHKTLNNTAYTVANFRQSSATTTPTVTTTAVSSVTSNSASSGGNATSDGGASVTARGVCWSTSVNPTISNSKTSDGTGMGIFTSEIKGLSSKTTYHARAYATNSIGTGYGADLTFTTSSACPPCSGEDVVINGVTYASGEICECTGATILLLDVTVQNNATVNFTATTLITVGSGTTFVSGSNSSLTSPKMSFQPGSHVESGAVLNVGQ